MLALWRREFLVPDVNLYRDIARARVPAAGLRATVADPDQSARYREFLDPLGYGDELRAVLRVGDSRRQGCTVIIASARRHVPTISPPTRRPPGQTRGVHNARRRAGSGTMSSRSLPWRRR